MINYTKKERSELHTKNLYSKSHIPTTTISDVDTKDLSP